VVGVSCISYVKCELAVDHRTVGKRLGSVDAHVTVAAQLACCVIGVSEWDYSCLVPSRGVVIVNIGLVIASIIAYRRSYLDAAQTIVNGGNGHGVNRTVVVNASIGSLGLLYRVGIGVVSVVLRELRFC